MWGNVVVSELILEENVVAGKSQVDCRRRRVSVYRDSPTAALPCPLRQRKTPV